MATFREKKTCPYCGNEVTLAFCRIIATNLKNVAEDGVAGTFSDEPPSKVLPERWYQVPTSGAEVVGRTRDGWPVVVESNISDQISFIGRGVQNLKALPGLYESAKPEDLPKRVCEKCDTPFPEGFEDRTVFSITIAGSSGAGKSHYLAAMIEEATRNQGLKFVGCTEFRPDEVTARLIHDYHLQVYRELKPMGITKFSRNTSEWKPLVFNVQFDGASPAMILINDIAGEVLQNRELRNTIVPFVRRSSALIFILDPDRLDDVADRLEGRTQFLRNEPGISQANLLAAFVDELAQSSNANTDKPVAIVISKSDLIEETGRNELSFLDDSPNELQEWIADRENVDLEVTSYLQEIHEGEIIEVVKRVQHHSFHAVAALGHSPLGDRIEKDKLNPIRCLDPLVTILMSLPGLCG